tara:strand:- start:3105 stop:4100 length:996 start_codon:yes stop_codon:yes gene_type:complete
MIEKRKVSAIIACYMDGQAIPIMYQRLKDVFKKLDIDHQIIFVNDCSPDNSQEVLEQIAESDSRVVVIRHSRNFGSQNAFTSGMAVADGDGVVLLDGDLQDPPELIEGFYHKWLEGFDVVYGQRVRRDTSWWMQICYKAFYQIFKRLSYIRVPLDAGDFSLMDRKVVDNLNRLPETNRFIRGLRAWIGFRQTGVPYERPERMFGTTTNSLLKNLGWARKAVVSFSFKPLDAITWLAILITGFAALGIVAQIILRVFAPDLVPPGFSTLVILILFMGGVQLLCLSIIGAYLAHIYDEVKHRSSYIVESIINDPRGSKNCPDDSNGREKRHRT